MIDRLVSVAQYPQQWIALAMCCSCMGYVFARFKSFGIAPTLSYLVILILILGWLQPIARLLQDDAYNFILLGFFVLGLVAGSARFLLRLAGWRHTSYLAKDNKPSLWRRFRNWQAMRTIRRVQASMRAREKREEEQEEVARERQRRQDHVRGSQRAQESSSGARRRSERFKNASQDKVVDPDRQARQDRARRESLEKEAELERRFRERNARRNEQEGFEPRPFRRKEASHTYSKSYKKANSHKNDKSRGQYSERPRPDPPPVRPKSSAARTPYEILGVHAGATPDEIKTAYRREAQRYAPDKHQHMSEVFQKEASDELVRINKAYEALK